MEKTLLFIKPDGVKREIIGKILTFIENSELNVVDIKMTHLKREVAEEFYSIHKGKDFFDVLIEHITNGRVVAILLEGNDAVKKGRLLVGDTDPEKARPGTIRHEFGLSKTDNTIHASDSEESAEREIGFFF